MNELLVKDALKSFLKEDIGTGDLSAELVFGDEDRSEGVFLAKEEGVICGVGLIEKAYSLFEGEYSVTLCKKDGDAVKKGDIIARVEAKTKTMLSCERVVLNLMQLMSGIATLTRKYKQTLDDDTIRLCDTRKTHPGLRVFEKYAVRVGGGYNHRMALYDGVMLKDNHIAYAGSIEKAVALVKEKLGHMVKTEVETETSEQVQEAVKAGADVIMFDNRSPEEIKELVKLISKEKNIITEASGGIRLDTIATFKGCGVDYLSVGEITNGAKPLDISFNSTGALKPGSGGEYIAE
ncbi:MAG: carboxylating nicotinate-nucleotide diphosphorylase [Firmicutes bacterium]|nr:carboxylating nicotinate-nucleotide diphosphorylase [Bacillota bacterium]